MKTKIFLLLTGLSTGAFTAQADTRIGIGLHIGIPAPVVVREAPPPRRVVVERPATAPAPNYVWVPAHYVWEGHWTWVEGAWAQPPETGAFWVEGKWDPQTQQWIEGHWERPAQYASMPPPPPPPPGPSASAEIYVEQAPPPPPREVQGPRPGRDYVWVTGYWSWRAGRHVWVAGHWDRPPRARAAWVAPRWERRGRGYVFVDGYWK